MTTQHNTMRHNISPLQLAPGRLIRSSAAKSRANQTIKRWVAQPGLGWATNQTCQRCLTMRGMDGTILSTQPIESGDMFKCHSHSLKALAGTKCANHSKPHPTSTKWLGAVTAGEVWGVCPVPGNQQRAEDRALPGCSDNRRMSQLYRAEEEESRTSATSTQPWASNEGSRRLRDDFTITEG